MQECFQAHPEKYGAILDDDGEENEGFDIENSSENDGDVHAKTTFHLNPEDS